jgi:UDP-N-acetyl-D-mannosaminuronic acid dehydrogenase
VTTDVCVLGLGHIGLPTALLAARDQEVVGVDVDENKVTTLAEGRLPFSEPGLDDLFESVRENFRPQTTVADADTYVLVTPTPVAPETDVADLSYVRAAAEAVASTVSPDDLVVLQSTVPPGTTERLVRPALAAGGVDPDSVHVAYSPERASPGRTLDEMVSNPRVVGARTTTARRRAVAFYESYVEGPIRTTTPGTAELVKLVENTYRDVNIALSNEFALLAEEFGLDVREAISLANEHPRVAVHDPGPGVGGHCIPIDPQFIAQHTTRDRLISLAREVNGSMPAHVARRGRAMLDEATDATVTLFGVAYKGGVGDTRSTPATPIRDLFAGYGYEVRAYDPHVDEFDGTLAPLPEAVAGADLAVVVTDHESFTELDPETVGARMATRRVLDARGLLDADRWRAADFAVSVLGDGRTV